MIVKTVMGEVKLKLSKPNQLDRVAMLHYERALEEASLAEKCHHCEHSVRIYDREAGEMMNWQCCHCHAMAQRCIMDYYQENRFANRDQRSAISA